jgi:hypothetical protein
VWRSASPSLARVYCRIQTNTIIGFGLAGIPGLFDAPITSVTRLTLCPETLLGALTKRKDVRSLTGVSNNAGAGDSGLGTVYAVHEISSTLSTSILRCRETSQQ